jgi:hypothetical protein
MIRNCKGILGLFYKGIVRGIVMRELYGMVEDVKSNSFLLFATTTWDSAPL